MNIAHRFGLWTLAALGALGTLGACGPQAAPPPAMVADPPPRPVTAQTASAPPVNPNAGAIAAFGALRERIVEQWLKDDPSLARAIGLHEHDGKIADYSQVGLEAQVKRLQEFRAELDKVDPKVLPPDDALDLEILRGEIELALFRRVDLEEWKKRPAFYEELFSVNSYVDREYAPLAERAKRLVEHEEAALASMDNVRKNLKGPMSKPVLETAIRIYAGYADYLRNDVVKLLRDVGDDAFKKKFTQTNEALAKQAEALAGHLKKVELPKGDDSHVLGPERYKKLLATQEGLSSSLAEFKAMGEQNLLENKKAYEKLKGSVKMTRPSAVELMSEATKLVMSSRAYIVEKGIVTIPNEDSPVVKESPPYKRWNAAFLESPGPFEKATNAFYYITLPDKSWSKKEQEGYIMTHGTLLATSVHEVYPGHYLQGEWARKAPTRVQKIFGSYSFTEGWAHYTEQLMIEEGYGKEDPQNATGQLMDALLRNCRFVASIGIHAEGMTLAAAEKRFMDDCYADKATARQQAVRATFDPGYFAYTLGKIQILELRAEAKTRLGDKFSLKKFHDALLAHGAPRIPLIRARVLASL